MRRDSALSVQFRALMLQEHKHYAGLNRMRLSCESPSMRRGRRTVCGIAAAAGVFLAASIGSLNGQTATPSSPGPAVPKLAGEAGLPPDKSRALLDRYCVTCHSDRLKTANLSLQGLDLTKVADHADLWEKVVRK